MALSANLTCADSAKYSFGRSARVGPAAPPSSRKIRPRSECPGHAAQPNRSIAVSTSSCLQEDLLVAASCSAAPLCIGSGDVFVPFTPETAGRRLTSTSPSWLEKVSEPDPGCCCENPLI